LTKLFLKYNSGTANTVVNYEANKRKNVVNLKITAAICPTTITINDPYTIYNLSTEVSKTIFKFGIETEFILPFNKNKWSIFVNPAYQKFEGEKNFTSKSDFGTNVNHHLTVDYSSIEVPAGIRHYLFLNKSSKIFIDAAYVFDVAGKTHINYDDNTKLDSDSRNNIAFGLGFDYKNRLSVAFSTGPSRQILGSYVAWSAKYSTTGIKLAYTFFKF
jgi:hypothetical protein